MINISLTHSQFADIYGKGEYCRDLSFDAISRVLSDIEDRQSVYDDEDGATIIIDWTEHFMNAGEVSQKDYSRMTQGSEDDISDFMDSLSDEELLDEDYIQESVCNIICENRGDEKLDSGSYLIRTEF